MIKKIALGLATAALALAGCSSNASSGASESAGSDTTIVVGASPTPQKQILEFVQKNLAEKAGINIEIREYQDYVQPNQALNDGEIDANYFQHVPYFNEDTKERGFSTLTHGEGIHLEPYGVYSNKIKDLKDLPDGAVVAITNDPSNQARALELLQDNGIIKLKDVDAPTIYDLAENPKNITFREADAPSVPKLLPDVDIAIVNGNFALQNGLTPSKDAIYTEKTEGNPYANVLAWNKNESEGKLASIAKLDDLLHSSEVSQYIKETWPDGEVIPAF
ncbi:MetQ/NlpA family ABC transporter substrate-binding protein [Neoactinobaculum massilliense]|uniref:MetQ/NlpA family ABC transporter substrate-binding protein n=1 Tax=Neoactinobaculum massilliense TaxID=2364794 RepID=UPI000F52FFB9|nr:MetQ/NlpA family ABC transporter substrate-binding protein [Neoactinobaculum massilliense]